MDWRRAFLVIAHRGASVYEPENTLSAFRRALDMGADAIEFDVRRSKEGLPVVIHDEDLRRVAGVDRKVSELTLEELKKIKVFGKDFIPTLDEVLAELNNRTTLFIEIKDEGIENKVVESVKKYGVCNNVLVISFNYTVLAKVKEIFSKLDIGLLTNRYPIPIKEATRLKAFAILPKYNLTSLQLVKEIHSKGLKVYVWTINDPSLALKMISYGVDGIATDNPMLKARIIQTM